MSSPGHTTQNGHPVIQCDSVYKIFGENAQKLLRDSKGNVDAKTFQESGCIVGVNNASFEVHKGDLLVVMGLSGSGKSTLLRCISRLTDATSGNIYIDGEDLLAMSTKKLIELRRNKMGMVFQSFALLPHKTVLENIAFPLQVKGSSTQDSIKRAKAMVDLVGLDGRENYFPRELSGGQQQRVGIARSLAVEPDIWFLDEPFSALDPLIRKEMQDEFLRLQGVLNKTILFILLFMGCSQQNEHDSVARVNGAILTKQMLEDISEKNKTLSRNEHISVWIEEELLYQAGKKHGVLRDKQVQATVDAFTRSLTIKKYINIHTRGSIKITDSEIKEHYNQNLNTFIRNTASARIDHFIINNKTKTKELKSLLLRKKQGKKTNELFNKYRVYSGTIERGSIEEPISSAIFTNKTKKRVFRPFEIQSKYHIIKIIEYYPV